jgi:hypothetical protein
LGVATATRIPKPAQQSTMAEGLRRHPVERYVVLDDMELFPDDDPRFVRTDTFKGLTDADVERAIAMLGQIDR